MVYAMAFFAWVASSVVLGPLLGRFASSGWHPDGGAEGGTPRVSASVSAPGDDGLEEV